MQKLIVSEIILHIVQNSPQRYFFLSFILLEKIFVNQFIKSFFVGLIIRKSITLAMLYVAISKLMVYFFGK